MPQKLFNNKKKKLSRRTLFMVLALLATTVIFFLQSISTPNNEPLPTLNAIQSNKHNHFIEFSTINDADNNRVLAFRFVNLEKENVQMHTNDGKLQISVTDVYHEYDFSQKTHVSDVATVQQIGDDSIVFSLPLERLGPYQVTIDEDGIFIKILDWGLEGKKIVIDPGHGYPDGGAQGPTGTLEKDVVLDISLKLKEILESKGAEVLLTRSDDYRPYPTSYVQDLWTRVEMAEDFGAHLFISIHNNASDISSVQGIETFYNPNVIQGHNNKKLAEVLQEQLSTDIERRDRGIHPANFTVLSSDQFIGALVELMFITNPTEELMLSNSDMIEKIAQSLAEGIESFFAN
ncbi:N-acetylmuramoyl-L-alanine amidase [Proteinivorax tanatarense]|uniref:N-acetylmuramoyl-L-alanine amidase n=1 Tax=Proteinivorax tanatarense TaxID=1260629 RepID=A0AAU7VIJ9_9FIRM